MSNLSIYDDKIGYIIDTRLYNSDNTSFSCVAKRNKSIAKKQFLFYFESK